MNDYQKYLAFKKMVKEYFVLEIDKFDLKDDKKYEDFIKKVVMILEV